MDRDSCYQDTSDPLPGNVCRKDDCISTTPSLAPCDFHRAYSLRLQVSQIRNHHSHRIRIPSGLVGKIFFLTASTDHLA